MESEVVVPATGNELNAQDGEDVTLTVSGGFGNLAQDVVEVHLMLKKVDGGEFAQGWFRVADLRAALEKVSED